MVNMVTVDIDVDVAPTFLSADPYAASRGQIVFHRQDEPRCPANFLISLKEFAMHKRPFT